MQWVEVVIDDAHVTRGQSDVVESSVLTDTHADDP
jgi:hypothetical protein